MDKIYQSAGIGIGVANQGEQVASNSRPVKVLGIPTLKVIDTTDGENPSWTIRFSRLPRSVSELKNMCEEGELLKQPYYTAALVVGILCHYPIDQEKTLEMLDYINGPANLSVHDKQFLEDCFRDKDYVPRSYFAGATVENHYQPTEPYTITIYENPYSRQIIDQGYINLYAQSAGADFKRHIRLRMKMSTEEWFLSEQMLLSDIRKPEGEDPWG